MNFSRKVFGIVAGQPRRFIHHPRRACLYVPGDDERKLRKVTTLRDVDCIILDNEDGVAQNRKDKARETILKFLTSTDKSMLPLTDWSIRVNSVQSGLLESDIKLLKDVLSTIFLPKVESTTDLQIFEKLLLENPGNDAKIRKLIFYVESCKSIMNLSQICQMASSSKAYQCVGIVFGSDDFIADLGTSGKSDSSFEILYARQKVVLCAKAFKWHAIDMVNINLNDDEGLRNQSIEGALMGYTGKQVIHPKQIDIVQSSFLPSEAKLKWAEGLLKAYDSHQKSGKGAFVHANQMIDAPTMKQARNIVSLYQRTQKL